MRQTCRRRSGSSFHLGKKYLSFESGFKTKGSSINEVTVIVGESVKDFVTVVLRPLEIKSLTMGEGVKYCPKLRDVIYGRILSITVCVSFVIQFRESLHKIRIL